MKKAKLQYRVPYADTDKMGVVYYANFLVYFERARNELLREIGYSYAEFEADDYMLPVIEAHCVYHMPALYDDLLDVTSEVGRLGRTKVKILCVVSRDEKLLAKGYTIHACVSSSTKKPVRIPKQFLERVTMNSL